MPPPLATDLLSLPSRWSHNSQPPPTCKTPHSPINFRLFSLRAIEKAIVGSDLGMTPNNDGEVIRLTLPQLTSERRNVALRNIRRDALKACEKLEKEKKLSKDIVKDLSSDLQASLKTEWEKKKEMYFPIRKYAIKV